MKKTTINSLFNQIPGFIGGGLLVTCILSTMTNISIIKNSLKDEPTTDRKEPTKTEATAPVQKPVVSQDTLRIVGAQPSSHSTNLFIVLADKQGNVLTQSHPLRIWLNNVKPLSDFFERGDTVVMEEGKIVENLTQKRLIDEFTRQK